MKGWHTLRALVSWLVVMLAIVILPLIALARQESAQPGDLIVRHGEGILGPPVWKNNIPHLGIYVGNNPQIKGNVVELTVDKIEGKSYGLINPANWTDEGRFKDPGFFSVLESEIPIRYQGKEITFQSLPETIKGQVRESVCQKAVSDIGRNPQEYFGQEYTRSDPQTSKRMVEPSYNCGDWALIDIYEKVLSDMGIQVLTRSKNEELRAVGLVDYFRNPVVFTKTCDPSRANDFLKRVESPWASSSLPISTPDLGGVEISPQPESSGRGGSDIKKKILESRPKEDATSWSAK